MVEVATSGDFGAIADLNVAAFAQFERSLDPASWQDMLRNLRNVDERARTTEFLVCRERDEIVGSVGYCSPGKSNPAIFSPDMASVVLLVVHPQHRGKGLGKALTAACIARARKDGAGAIGLFTSELMQPAHNVYRALGFELDSELPARYGIRYFRFVLPLERLVIPGI
jgi:ribosomal protein S18 acetylase RimI-like enzyme